MHSANEQFEQYCKQQFHEKNWNAEATHICSKCFTASNKESKIKDEVLLCGCGTNLEEINSQAGKKAREYFLNQLQTDFRKSLKEVRSKDVTFSSADYAHAFQICSDDLDITFSSEDYAHVENVVEVDLSAVEENDESLEDVLAICEDCGHLSKFPYRFKGTTQDCAKCGSFVDVDLYYSGWVNLQSAKKENHSDVEDWESLLTVFKSKFGSLLGFNRKKEVEFLGNLTGEGYLINYGDEWVKGASIHIEDVSRKKFFYKFCRKQFHEKAWHLKATYICTKCFKACHKQYQGSACSCAELAQPAKFGTYAAKQAVEDFLQLIWNRFLEDPEDEQQKPLQKRKIHEPVNDVKVRKESSHVPVSRSFQGTPTNPIFLSTSGFSSILKKIPYRVFFVIALSAFSGIVVGLQNAAHNDPFLYVDPVLVVCVVFLSFSLALILTAIYLLPFHIARYKKKKNSTAIGILNLFLGWTFLGWVCALVWACMED